MARERGEKRKRGEGDSGGAGFNLCELLGVRGDRGPGKANTHCGTGSEYVLNEGVEVVGACVRLDEYLCFLGGVDGGMLATRLGFNAL